MTEPTPEPQPNTDGFYPAFEIDVPYIWHINGPDGIEHQLRCDFPTTSGMLPCTCHSQRSRGTLWYYLWLQWQHSRVYADPATFPIQWPTELVIGITGHDGEATP